MTQHIADLTVDRLVVGPTSAAPIVLEATDAGAHISILDAHGRVRVQLSRHGDRYGVLVLNARGEVRFDLVAGEEYGTFVVHQGADIRDLKTSAMQPIPRLPVPPGVRVGV